MIFIWIRENILNNLILKILSLLFAILLWYYVGSKGVIETNMIVPLELKNLPDSYFISGDVIDYIDVRLKGKENILSLLKGNQINLYLDLSNVKVGNNIFNLKPENINTPPNIEVTWINPKRINIKIER